MMRAINLAAVVLVAALAFGVYQAKTRAREDAARVAELEAQVVAASGDIEVLRAEIAHLEDPAALRRLAEAELGLIPIDPLRVVTIGEAPLFLRASAWPFDPDHGRVAAIRPASGRVP